MLNINNSILNRVTILNKVNIIINGFRLFIQSGQPKLKFYLYVYLR